MPEKVMKALALKAHSFLPEQYFVEYEAE